MKVTLKYEREQQEGPCAIWCKVIRDDDWIIAGGYGETRDTARAKAIRNAKVRVDADPIESEEVEI
jgi:hypothetical protein